MNETTRTTSWFVGFALTAIMVILVLVAFQIERRNDAIEAINQSAQRIEVAATHTEQVLVDVVEARDAPEAVAQQKAIREAVSQIHSIHALLCSTPELADNPECDG